MKSLSQYESTLGKFILRSFIVRKVWTADRGLNFAVGTPCGNGKCQKTIRKQKKWTSTGGGAKHHK